MMRVIDAQLPKSSSTTIIPSASSSLFPRSGNHRKRSRSRFYSTSLIYNYRNNRRCTRTSLTEKWYRNSSLHRSASLRVTPWTVVLTIKSYFGTHFQPLRPKVMKQSLMKSYQRKQLASLRRLIGFIAVKGAIMMMVVAKLRTSNHKIRAAN